MVRCAASLAAGAVPEELASPTCVPSPLSLPVCLLQGRVCTTRFATALHRADTTLSTGVQRCAVLDPPHACVALLPRVEATRKRVKKHTAVVDAHG